jgi:RNA exonuclease 1
MAHSIGWSDEVIMQPSGVFARKSQPQGGTWALDGDLLHLKWRLQRNRADEADGLVGDDNEDEDSYSLDVLVAEDASMHYFVTESVTDATYAHETPDHMKTKRQRTDGDQPRKIRMSLIKATLASIPRDGSGAVIRAEKQSANTRANGEATSTQPFDVASLKQEDYDAFVSSQAELAHHLFPIDVAVEQAALMQESKGASRDVFVQTRARPATVPKPTDRADVIALDCEMCETDIGMELTRITVVNALGEVIYDQLVKPQNTIINYHTQYSGITEEMLVSTRHILADVQRDLLENFLFEDTILVGHSLTSDLRALRIVHLKIADTAILYPHERGFPFRASLKMLMKTYLGKDIQTKLQHGHDSAEDARAAMELLIQKIRRGAEYGLPEVGLTSTAFDTLPDKLASRNKRLAMLTYEHKLSGEWVLEERKAWDRYASGHHQLAVHNPSDHAALLVNKEAEPHPTIAEVSHTGFDADVLVEKVKAATARGDDVCWLEINQVSDQAAAKDFILHHGRWMRRQETYCDQVDTLLRRLRDDAIADDTLLMVIPQGDLGVLRYVKALSTRSRWNDVTPEKAIAGELKEAVSDAFRGAWDGCAFFTQK